MSRVYVRVLGPTELEVDGTVVTLTTRCTRILALLVAADGDAVPISDLHRELWPDSVDRTHRKQQSRTDVQKRISLLRKAMDLKSAGQGVPLLHTETVINGSAAESAYRLVLDRTSLDCAEFEHLVSQALVERPAAAAEMLTRALALWHGPPLTEAGNAEFAASRVNRLHQLRATGVHELVSCLVKLGRLDAALPLAERTAAAHPHDARAGDQLAEIRAELHNRHANEVFRHELSSPRCTVVAIRGDLFTQDDAHLVVGFTDTFDTSTHRNEQISADSVQGQLLERLFDGDVSVLDRELRRGLRRIPPVGKETPRDKPKGKRLRYPIGTVVPVAQGGRLVFAVAYSKQRNDLSAESGLEHLRDSLVNLWSAVARRGQLRPVAVPLVGSKLARVPKLSRTELMSLIIDTFAAARWEGSAVTPELRIVLRPDEVREVDLPAVVRFLTNRRDTDGP